MIGGSLERLEDDEDRGRVEGREVWLESRFKFYRVMLTGRQTLGGGCVAGCHLRFP